MLKKLSQKRKKKGFTLVELIVVIAILGILVAIAVPRFAGFRKDAALKADQASAANIAKAAELYAMDNKVEKGEVNIDHLVSKDLLASTPQVKGEGSGFTLMKNEKGEFIVSYTGGDQLYPTKGESEGESDSEGS